MSGLSIMCLSKCHCAPSRLRGPDANLIVATPLIDDAFVTS